MLFRNFFSLEIQNISSCLTNLRLNVIDGIHLKINIFRDVSEPALQKLENIDEVKLNPQKYFKKSSNRFQCIPGAVDA